MGTVITGPNPAFAAQFDRPQENPASQLSQLLALKQQQQLAPLQLQEAQQRAQSGQLQLQQEQQAQKDSEAFRAAMSDPSMQGKTLGDIADTLARKGGLSAQTYSALKKADIEQRQSLAMLDKDQLANAKAAHEQTQQLYNNIQNLPDDALQAQWPQIVQQYNSIPGNQKLPLNPQQPMTKEQLKQFAPFVSMQNAYLDDAISRQDKMAGAQKTAAEAAKTQFEAQQMAQNGGLTATQLETQNYHKQEIAARKAQLGIEGARLAFEKAKQGTQDQQAIESQAQQIANGDVKAPSLARNNPYNRALMARVYEINPKYSDSLYTATQDLSSKPNSMGGNVGRLGTAILHADRALDNSKNLGFSEGLLTGVATSGTSAYKQDAEFLTGEIGQYVTGGKLTVDEGRKLSTDLMSSRQGVRDSAIKEIINLSKGKLQSQMGQFKNATQTDFPIDRVFQEPDIKEALQRHGVIGGASGGGVSVTAPNGKVYSFKDQASADAFKQKAGIQ